MTVEVAAGVEVVETDCGTRREPFAAERRSVRAREQRTAEDLLARLQGAGGCANPSPLSCAEVGNLQQVGIPTNIIVTTIQDAGGCYTVESIQCLKKLGLPSVVIHAAQQAR